MEKKGTAMNADRLGTYEKTFPYGELATASSTSGEKFGTYWRDAGSGLDYGVNRYYSSQMGRFLSADPYQASGGTANPQSWNRYAYVENNPVNFHDPKGLYTCEPGEGCHDEPDCDDLKTKWAPGTGPCIAPASGKPRRTYFLVLDKFGDAPIDCYRVPLDEKLAVTREISYRLMFMEEGMPRPMGFAATIWEHLKGHEPVSGLNSGSGGVPGWFVDTLSTLAGASPQIDWQTFTAKVDGVHVGVPVMGAPWGDAAEQHIVKHKGYVSINGNIGGKIDKDGRLIKGTYTECN